jgi:hypothetical protein
MSNPEMSSEEGAELVHQLASNLGMTLVDIVEALPAAPNDFLELPVSARMFSAFLTSALAGTDVDQRQGLLEACMGGLLLYLEADCLRSGIGYPDIRILVRDGNGQASEN